MRISPAEVGTLVHDAGLVVVGERHGTNEFPRLFGDLAAAAARAGRFILALEFGDDARDATSAYVHGPPTAEIRGALLATASWQQRDGRASAAMLRLVNEVRELVRLGAQVEVDVFNAAPAGNPFDARYQIEREQLMAERLVRIRSQGPTLALTGSVHAELAPRADAVDGFVPAAALVAEEVGLLSLPGRYSGGHSWATLPIDGQLVVGVHAIQGQDLGEAEFIDVGPESAVRTGLAYVGRITPSPPAVDNAPPA